ncbi:MAG: zinc protease [Blastocatellia bacterium]|nr:zinc protease [Blastocatellia bacterium]
MRLRRLINVTLPYINGTAESGVLSAEGAADGSQGQAQRHPWIALTKRSRPEGARGKHDRDRSSRYSPAPLQGAGARSYRVQGWRASRLPLATFFCPYRATPVRRFLVVISLVLVAITAAPTAFIQNSYACRDTSHSMKSADTNTVLLPNRSPLVSFRILFMTGSAYDPKGKEGLASLTAAMLAEGGSRTKTLSEITDAMYPMATSFEWQVDKEMSVFSGSTHIDNLDKYYALIREMLLDPGFREDDFKRLKEDAINYLKTSLRSGNDEELGKEVLYTMIYPSTHSYGHQNMGAIGALEKLTIKDVRDFYQNNFTQANLVIGLAGGYPDKFPAQVQADFSKLPKGSPNGLKLSQPTQTAGTKIEIVQRETRSTAVSLGFPINVTRPNKDWPALAVVASYFGQHRSSNSYLYQRLREARGLNYGDYAYIEYFPRGMFQFEPDPNLGRQQQIFQIWIRPVEPANGHFVLRAALYEYDKLVREGMSQEAFESTREFLSKYVNVLTATQDAQLGYALDSRYYHIADFPTYMREQLAKLTLDDVNRAIKLYLKSDAMRVAVVTKDAAGLRDAILSNKPSPITYNAPKPKEITDEDKVIEAYKIVVKPADVTIVPVDRVFQ